MAGGGFQWEVHHCVCLLVGIYELEMIVPFILLNRVGKAGWQNWFDVMRMLNMWGFTGRGEKWAGLRKYCCATHSLFDYGIRGWVCLQRVCVCVFFFFFFYRGNFVFGNLFV